MTKIQETLKNDLINAMRAKNTVKLDVIRFINAQIKNAEIELRAAGKELTDEEITVVLLKESKKRIESINIYNASGREDLARAEIDELKVLQEYLPKLMTEDEIKIAIDYEVSMLSDSDRNFNSAIKILMPRFKGKADGKLVAEILKRAVPS